MLDGTSLSDALARSRRCGKCGGGMIEDHENGELFCGICGFVVKERLAKPDRAMRDDDGNLEAAREAVFGIRGPASTLIGKATNGKAETDFKNAIMRGEKWARRDASPEEKTIVRYMDEVRKINSNFFSVVPNGFEAECEKLMIEAEAKGINRAGSEFIAPAVIYAACRRMGIAKTIDEVGVAAGIRKRQYGWKEGALKEIDTAEMLKVAAAYREMHKRGIDVAASGFPEGAETNVNDPTYYVQRIASATSANISASTQRMAIEKIKVMRQSWFAEGKKPTVLACVALYLACNEHREPITQEDICNAAMITVDSLRKKINQIRENVQLAEKLGVWPRAKRSACAN